MTIFGFNTDIKHGETVYHVQSEARTQDLLLQSQVFIKGRCIGKMATSYAHSVLQPDFTEEHMHDLLKTQHKSLVDATRAGQIEKLLKHEVAVQDAGGQGLSIEWLNHDAPHDPAAVVMRVHVSDAGAAVAGAQLTTRVRFSADAPVASETTTDAEGNSEVTLSFVDAPEDAAALVQAAHNGKNATRKFRLKRGR